MYTSHYGLTAKPFSIVPDPSVLFLSKTHEKAINQLEFGLCEKVGFILLTGETGTGKTTLIRHMLNKMPSEVDSAVIFNTNFSSDQLFRLILNEFEIPCHSPGIQGGNRVSITNLASPVCSPAICRPKLPNESTGVSRVDRQLLEPEVARNASRHPYVNLPAGAQLTRAVAAPAVSSRFHETAARSEPR